MAHDFSLQNNNFDFIEYNGKKLIAIDPDSLFGLDWENLIRHHYVSEDVLRSYADRLDLCWGVICSSQKLSESFMRDFSDKLHWDDICSYNELSEEFIFDFKDRVNWSILSMKKEFSLDFLEKLKDKIKWEHYLQKFLLLVEILNKYREYILKHMDVVCKYQILTEEFMREYVDHLDWYSVCKYQKMSESFIEEFRDLVNWDMIGMYQVLSENFILSYSNRLSSSKLLRNESIDHSQLDKDFWNSFRVAKKMCS
jgi:hypothetical protein